MTLYKINIIVIINRNTHYTDEYTVHHEYGNNTLKNLRNVFAKIYFTGNNYSLLNSELKPHAKYYVYETFLTCSALSQ